MAEDSEEIEIRTKRLLMRPLRLNDAEDVFLMRSHPEVMRFTSSLPEKELQQSRHWITNCLSRPNCWNFSMELLPFTSTTVPSSEGPTSGETYIPKVVGVIGAMRTPEVGYMINADYWGQGYASEALLGFMPAFFDHYSGQERHDFAEALVDSTHTPSRRVLEKAGFALVEVKKQDFKSPSQGLRDMCVYRAWKTAHVQDRAVDRIIGEETRNTR